MAKPNEHDTRKDKNHPKSQQDADNSNEPKWTKIPPPKEYLEEKRYYTDPYVVPGNYQKMTEYVSPPSYKPRSHSREEFQKANGRPFTPKAIEPLEQPQSMQPHGKSQVGKPPGKSRPPDPGYITPHPIIESDMRSDDDSDNPLHAIDSGDLRAGYDPIFPQNREQLYFVKDDGPSSKRPPSRRHSKQEQNFKQKIREKIIAFGL